MPGDIDHDYFPWTSSQNSEDYLKTKNAYGMCLLLINCINNCIIH